MHMYLSPIQGKKEDARDGWGGGADPYCSVQQMTTIDDALKVIAFWD